MRLDSLTMAPTFKRMMQDRNARLAARVQERRIAAKTVRFTAPPPPPLAQPAPAPTLFNDDLLSYILAGNAIFTLESARTGARHTLKITKAKDKDGQYGNEPAWFVAHLTGPDNEASYQYLGLIKEGTYRPNHQRVQADAPSQKVATWFLNGALKGQPLPEGLNVLKSKHCARLLTTPDSIAMGLGPECASKAMG